MLLDVWVIHHNSIDYIYATQCSSQYVYNKIEVNTFEKTLKVGLLSINDWMKLYHQVLYVRHKFPNQIKYFAISWEYASSHCLG